MTMRAAAALLLAACCLAAAAAPARGDLLFSLGREGEPASFGYAAASAGGSPEPLYTRHQLVEPVDVVAVAAANVTLYRDRALGAVYRTHAGWPRGSNASAVAFRVPPAPPLGPNSTAAADRGLAVCPRTGRVYAAAGDRVLAAASVKAAAAGQWAAFASVGAAAAPDGAGLVDPRVVLALDDAGDRLYVSFIAACVLSERTAYYCQPDGAGGGGGAVVTAVARFNTSDASGDAPPELFSSSFAQLYRGRYDCAVCLAVGSGQAAWCQCGSLRTWPAGRGEGALPTRGLPVDMHLGMPIYARVTAAAVLDPLTLAFVGRCVTGDECGVTQVLSGPTNTSCGDKYPNPCQYNSFQVPVFASSLAQLPAAPGAFDGAMLIGGVMNIDSRWVEYPSVGALFKVDGTLGGGAGAPPVLSDLLARRPTVVAAAAGRLWGVDNTTGGLVSAPLARPGTAAARTLLHPLEPTRLDQRYAGRPRALAHDPAAGLLWFDTYIPRGETEFDGSAEWHLLSSPRPDQAPAGGGNATVARHLNATGGAGAAAGRARAAADAAGRHVYYLTARGEVWRRTLATGEARVCARQYCCGSYWSRPRPSPLVDFFLDEANGTMLLVAVAPFQCNGLNSCPRTVLLRAPLDCSAPEPVYAWPAAGEYGYYDRGGGFFGSSYGGDASALAPPGTPQAANGSYYAAYPRDDDDHLPQGVALFSSAPPAVRHFVHLGTRVRSLEATRDGVLLATEQGLLAACNASVEACAVVPLADAVQPRAFCEAAGRLYYFDAAYGAVLARPLGAPRNASAARVVARVAPPAAAFGGSYDSPVRAMAADEASGLLYVTLGVAGADTPSGRAPAPAPGLYSAPLDGPPAALRPVALAGPALLNSTGFGGLAVLPGGARALVGLATAPERFKTAPVLAELELATGAVTRWQRLAEPSFEGDPVPYEVALAAGGAPVVLLETVDDSSGNSFTCQGVYGCDLAGGRVCGNFTQLSACSSAGTSSVYYGNPCLRGLATRANGTFFYVDQCRFDTYGGPALMAGGGAADGVAAVAQLYRNPASWAGEESQGTSAARLADDGLSLLVADDDTVVSFRLPHGLVASHEAALSPPPPPPAHVAWTREPVLPAFRVRSVAAAPGGGGGALAFSAGAGMTRGWAPAWLGALDEATARGAAAAWGNATGFVLAPFARRPLRTEGGGPAQADRLAVYGGGGGGGGGVAQLGAVAVDSRRAAVFVAAPGNATARALAQRPVGEPSAARFASSSAVDGPRGEVLWVDNGAGAVMRARLNGTAAHAVEVTVGEHSVWNTSAVALDPARHELYFTSRNQSAVLAVPLPAAVDAQPRPGDVRVVLRAAGATFVALAFDAGALYAVEGDHAARPAAAASSVVVWKRSSGVASRLDLPGAPVSVAASQGLY